MNKIPIVLATDKNCISQMYTTMLSIIMNKNKDTFCDFYCLVPKKFSKKTNKLFQKLVKKYQNVSIKFINMKNAFSDLEMQISHITSPTFYRLKLAEILPQYDKVIYLDIDTVVLKDLSEFYNTDLGDNYIAGVHAAGYVIERECLRTYYDSIGLPDMKYYINAGVILFNLDQIRKENVTERFLEATKNQYRFMDQDIINLICYGRTKHVDFRYNVMSTYNARFLQKEDLEKQVYEIYGEESFKDSIKNPVIIHYASDLKPWVKKDIWMGKYWHKYGMKSPFKIKWNQKEKPETRFLRQIEENKFKKTVFWGASLYLQDLINSGKIKKHKILGIIDKDTSKHGKTIGDFKIFAPEDLTKLRAEIVIFSIKHFYKIVYPQVKQYLDENVPKIKLMPNVFDFNKK